MSTDHTGTGTLNRVLVVVCWAGGDMAERGEPCDGGLGTRPDAQGGGGVRRHKARTVDHGVARHGRAVRQPNLLDAGGGGSAGPRGAEGLPGEDERAVEQHSDHGPRRAHLSGARDHRGAGRHRRARAGCGRQPDCRSGDERPALRLDQPDAVLLARGAGGRGGARG
eukprot:2348172-Pyramimonas_sp.AAC.1